MCGTDIPVPEIMAVIHQPKIKEIALMGESEFFVAIQCLNINKNLIDQDKTPSQITNNFQIFMTIMQQEEAKDKKEITKNLLSILFPNYNILFSPRSLILSKSDLPNITIDESNFEILQQILQQIFCLSSQKNQQAGFNPANDKAKEIAEKLMRGRKRVAELNGSANASIFTQYLSILAIGLQMPISELKDLTMFQLYDLVERYQLYISWDIDIRARLAGASPDDKPDNWMKNIH